MRRWTDGKSWSASRVSGSFLTYREMEGKRGGNGFAPIAATRPGRTPESTRGSDSDLELAGEDGPDGYRYKPDGLMKQSFSITTSTGNHLHLISYYARSHPTAQALVQPTNDPGLRHIRPAKGMYPESTVHEQQNIPAITRSPMVSGPLAAVPQMANYARSGPGLPPNYPPHGYAWPSPPMSTAHGYGYHFGPGSLPPPQAGNQNSHAPLSYTQSMPPNSQAPHPSSYNQPHPPSAENNFAHPSPLSTHHRNSSSGSSLSQYHTNPSPHLAPSLLGPQQQPQSQSPSSTPPLAKMDPRIDPRLIAPSPLAQQQTLHSADKARTPSPHPKQEPRSNTSTPKENGASQASTIPSIGAIMNGSSKDNADAQSDASGRSSSRSPGGTKKEGPQDIPSEKLGFGEDMRALRVLDRAFKT